MGSPFEYVGHGEVCMGCVDVIRTGDTVAPVDEDRPERLLCVACWWLQQCDLSLPSWTRPAGGRTRLDGVFRTAKHDTA
jgi:hypothetical protein